MGHKKSNRSLEIIVNGAMTGHQQLQVALSC